MTPRQFFELWVRFREEREWQDNMTARIECRMVNLQMAEDKQHKVEDFLQYRPQGVVLESNKSDDRPAWMVQRENMKTFTAGRRQRNKRINNE